MSTEELLYLWGCAPLQVYYLRPGVFSRAVMKDITVCVDDGSCVLQSPRTVSPGTHTGGWGLA